MIRNVRIPAKKCTCEVCMHSWHSIAQKIPDCCANIACRSREWNGVKQRVVKPRIELPKPERVRRYEANDGGINF